MPRKKIDLPHTLEHLSILDADGEVDTELRPDLNEDQLQQLYRMMLLSRRFDERLLSLQRRGPTLLDGRHERGPREGIGPLAQGMGIGHEVRDLQGRGPAPPNQCCR